MTRSKTRINKSMEALPTEGLERYLDTEELADITGMSRRYWEVKRSHGGGPSFIKIGKSVRYPWSALKSWLDDQGLHTNTRDGGK